MNPIELQTFIKIKWPSLKQRIICADRVYVDGISDKTVHKFWKRWKFGFLGFGGQPLYMEESQDCDDLVRHFIVQFRRKNKVKGKAQPIFYTTWNKHAYASYRNTDQKIVSMDLRDGKLYSIETFLVEMV